MPTPQEARKWFLELGGQRKGPLTLRDVEGLLRDGAVFPTTPIFSNDPGIKPLTVIEALRKYSVPTPLPKTGGSGTGPVKSLRPTPVPRAATAGFSDLSESDDDPVTDLFDTYQTARERTNKPTPPAFTDPTTAETKLDASVLRWK